MAAGIPLLHDFARADEYHSKSWLRLNDLLGRVADRRLPTVLFAFCTTLVFATVETMVDHLAYRRRSDSGLIRRYKRVASAGGAGIVAGLLLMARGHRRRIVREELHRVMELNHRLRNSLEIIVDAHHLEHDVKHREMMFKTVESISTALEQLFPMPGTQRRKHISDRVRQDWNAVENR